MGYVHRLRKESVCGIQDIGNLFFLHPSLCYYVFLAQPLFSGAVVLRIPKSVQSNLLPK